ncbi:type I-F CRISPR-associated protein Csy2 [Candidatus Babeliales bacterium]|jgi:CRISPR-associated protein Csy2|nr:type I-F CRISPR-associated protein Csy2 [Candidatus Babeliales bacterium]
MKKVLLIPHINVHNANALSSPYTIGFPAMTAFLGGVHALQRILNHGNFKEVNFKSVAVVCHEIDLHTYKGQGDYVYSIVGTGNPLDKSGKRPAFIEEGRCHLDVSLVIEYEGIEKDDEDEALEEIKTALYAKMKLAGGDILSFNISEFLKIHDNKTFSRLTRKLMPGYVIIERRELIEKSMENGLDAIDAMLDYLKVMHRSEKDSDGNVSWTSRRKTSGWIVPVATGFHGITDLCQAKNQRDPDTRHRFAETIVTLGEFVMPYRIKNLAHMLWHYHTDLENNLYICQQNNRKIN